MTDKPRLRGVSHQIAFFVALVAGPLLVFAQPTPRGRAVTAVYAVLLAGMLGVSASYHRLARGPRSVAWWGRADHSMIFVFIAGTYTPFCVLAMAQPAGDQLLGVVWLGAALGTLRAVFWLDAPRIVNAALYAIVGWCGLGFATEIRDALEPVSLWLMLAGGVLYTAGAVVYAVRRPDPAPLVFGYHEVFHVLVLIACSCHFAAVARLVA